MSAPSDQTPGDAPAFSDLALSDAVLEALSDVGYETPSPIQAATIPHLLAGKDVVGQAQTGTGKTAAFALPILSKIDVREAVPQALILVPTRELAIQVAEAFQRYATYMKGFHVLPVYGGQSYTPQLQSLRRGVQVVVATPGRAMDHIKRGTLNLSSLRHLVLDEADEMLRMGFIDDVEWILEQAPAERQIALFSATMPPQVRRIAQRHLREPAEVTIRSKTTTASQIRQRYWIVSGMHKLDALTRILEAETFDAMIVFTRTKIATEELAERLAARGFAVEALNGDIAQVQRERTVARLKSGQIDIVVATDVAARGLDVERVSHVVNYDVPYDPESYVHRIGRTGRAGRSGEAILFIAPRERNMLRVIERATRQTIESMQLPTVEDVNERRVARFNEKLTAAIESGAGQMFLPLIESYERDHNISSTEIAAALASIAQGATPLLLEASGGSASPYASTDASFEQSEGRSDRGKRREPREFAETRGKTSRRERSERADPEDYRRERPARAGRDDHSHARSERTGQDDFHQDRAERVDENDRRRAWSEREDREGSRRAERAPRGQADATSETPSTAWGNVRERQSTPSQEEPSASPAQPKPLNRRERRALERAQREAEGTTQPHEQPPGNDDEQAASPSAAEQRASKEPSERYTGERRGGADGPASTGERRGKAEGSASSDEHRGRAEGSAGSDERPGRTEGRVARDERQQRAEARVARGEHRGRTEERAPRGERSRTAESRDERTPKRSVRHREDATFDAPTNEDREPRRARRGGDEDVETYRIEVGHEHGVKPGNIVGAIANEVGLEGRHIGRVVIRDDHSFVDLPAGMPKEVFRQLQKVRVAGQPLQISRALKTHVEKLRRERPSAPKFKGKSQRPAQRGRRK